MVARTIWGVITYFLFLGPVAISYSTCEKTTWKYSENSPTWDYIMIVPYAICWRGPNKDHLEK